MRAVGRPVDTDTFYRKQFGSVIASASRSACCECCHKQLQMHAPTAWPCQVGKGASSLFAPIPHNLHTSLIMATSAIDIMRATLDDDYEPTPEDISLVVGTLTEEEKKWRDRHEMLKLEGYDLRPRLRPGWKPSWLESGADPFKCEDGENLPVGCFAYQSNPPF